MPASNPQIAVKISAKADEFSASVAQIKKDLASLPKLAERAGRGMDRGAARFSGFDMGKEITRATRAARGGLGLGLGGIGAVSRMVPGLGALAGVASVAGIGEMVSRFASAGVEIQNTARLAGTSAAGLNSLRGAARLIGLSAGDADAAMTGLNHTLADAVYGRNPEAARYFQQAGIAIGSIAHGAYTAERVLPGVVDELTKLAKQNPLAAEHLAQIWGIPSSALPMLIRGREALEANRHEVERMYGSMDQYLASSEKFTDSTARLGLASERLGMTITSVLEPHLTPMLLQLSRFVEAHDQDIGQAFDRIGTALEKTDWAAVGHGIEGVGRMLTYATQNADLLTRGFETLAGTVIIRSILGNTLLGRYLTAGLVAHEALAAADPQDRAGSWVDRNIPGAAAADDWFARHLGVGRTFAQQQAAQQQIDHERAQAVHQDNRATGAWEYPGEGGPSNDPRLPRGVRNNNPLNLEYRGQQGSVGSDGRFGRYGDMRDGVGAGLRQLLMYQERDGLGTVSSMINRWAPPSENDTNSYARRVAAAMGVDPNTPVNLRDPEAASRMIGAMAQVENGRPINPRLIREGVNRALGRDDEDGLRWSLDA